MLHCGGMLGVKPDFSGSRRWAGYHWLQGIDVQLEHTTIIHTRPIPANLPSLR